MNSRQKGKRGELEGSKEWSSVMGVPSRRGQQFSGGGDSPDIVHGCEGVHLEVKRTEQGNLYVWLQQAIEDAGAQVPVVLHRRNNQPWVVVMRLADVPRFAVAAAACPKVQAVFDQQIPADVPGEDTPPTG